MAKGLFKILKASFSKWRARGRDKNGKKARWNLGKLRGKKGKKQPNT